MSFESKRFEQKYNFYCSNNWRHLKKNVAAIWCFKMICLKTFSSSYNFKEYKDSPCLFIRRFTNEI